MHGMNLVKMPVVSYSRILNLLHHTHIIIAPVVRQLLLVVQLEMVHQHGFSRVPRLGGIQEQPLDVALEFGTIRR